LYSLNPFCGFGSSIIFSLVRSKKIETVFVGLFSVFVFCPLNF
jgi:hypothetical protein